MLQAVVLLYSVHVTAEAIHRKNGHGCPGDQVTKMEDWFEVHKASDQEGRCMALAVEKTGPARLACRLFVLQMMAPSCSSCSDAGQAKKGVALKPLPALLLAARHVIDPLDKALLKCSLRGTEGEAGRRMMVRNF